PDMQGSGSVRDLREAATLSVELENILIQFSQGTTRSAQLNMMNDLLYAWAKTSGMIEGLQGRAGLDHVRYESIGSQTAAANGSSGQATSPYWASMVESWERKMHILEAFNGRYFFRLPNETSDLLSAVTGITYVAPE